MDEAEKGVTAAPTSQDGERLAAIRARAAAATPGPWVVEYEGCDCGGDWGCSHGQYARGIWTPRHRPWNFPNAPEADICDPAKSDDYVHHSVSEMADLPDDDIEFIAEARSAVDWLIAEVDRLRVQEQKTAATDE